MAAKKAKKIKKSKKTAKKSGLKTAKKMAVKAKSTAKTAKKSAKKSAPKSSAKSKAVRPLAAMANPGKPLAIGEVIPAFSVAATGGYTVTREALKGKSVVLYFYPKDATPGCTLEGHEFTRLQTEFRAIGVEVFGVSRDDLKSHEKFKAKECYSIDLLSDAEGQLCGIFDVVKLKNMYGKQVMGIQRSTFLLDGEGRLVHEWRAVKAEGHAQEVLNYLKNP